MCLPMAQVASVCTSSDREVNTATSSDESHLSLVQHNRPPEPHLRQNMHSHTLNRTVL